MQKYNNSLNRTQQIVKPMITKQKIEWIGEEQAASMMGYTNLNWFRRLVKRGLLPINYSSIRNRSHRYNKIDIENYLYENSSLAS